MPNLQIILECSKEEFAHEDLNSLYEEALNLQNKLTFTDNLALVFFNDRVGLKDLANKAKPIFVDFLEGKLAHRRKFGGGRKSEAVARACFGDFKEPIIFDGTAGLGRDSFVLAYLGAKVHMFERNPIVRIILKDGLRRAYNSDEANFFKEHMIFEEEKSIWDYKGDIKPNTVYIDPMYPERKKSAQVKNDMKTFHSLVGFDNDIEKLLTNALEIAQNRVVLKRPQYAQKELENFLMGSVETDSQRFDIYLPHRT